MNITLRALLWVVYLIATGTAQVGVAPVIKAEPAGRVA